MARKKEKEIERINGQLKTRNFSCSINKKLTEPLIAMYGGGTKIIEEHFVKRFGLKDTWELENFISELIFEKAGMKRRDNLTRQIEISSCDSIISFYTEKLETPMNDNEKETIKQWIKDAKETKEVLSKK